MVGGDTVTLPESVVQDIAVLKTQYGEMRRTIDDGNRITQGAVAQLSGRVETIADMMRSIATLQAQHESHRDAVGRAFVEINAAEADLAEHIAEEDKWRQDHERENLRVEKRITLWQGIAIGISLTIGIATAVALWGGGIVLENINDDINELESDRKTFDGRVDKLERDAAINHAR